MGRVKSFVSIGTAGDLAKGLYPEGVILCADALRDEGVSHHHVPDGGLALPDEALSDELGSAFDAAGVPYHSGISWTTDAVYRETKEEIASFVSRGAITVEMEASALFTVDRYRHVPIAARFTISDTLSETDWQPEFLSKDTIPALKR